MIIEYTLNIETPFTHGIDIAVDEAGKHYAYIEDGAEFNTGDLTNCAEVTGDDLHTVVAVMKDFTNATFDLDNGIMTEDEWTAELAKYGLDNLPALSGE